MGLEDLVPSFLSGSGFELPDWASGILTGIGDVGGDVLKFGKDVFTGPASTYGVVKKLLAPSGGGATTSPTQGGPLFPKTGGSDDVSYSDIRQKMVDHLGFAPRRKSVYRLIRDLGFNTASTVLGIDTSDGIWLYTHRRTGSRRHFVQTMIRQIRRAEGFRHQLSRYSSRLPRARRAAPARRRRRR